MERGRILGLSSDLGAIVRSTAIRVNFPSRGCDPFVILTAMPRPWLLASSGLMFATYTHALVPRSNGAIHVHGACDDGPILVFCCGELRR